ncbi:hypothetical protein [Actinomadura napierensis]|uniref:Uncharacterized protein n=1 Tax=Actinomadura napierensis TaxID=267854 RepID=A0ABN2ZW03_9ACTN
MTEFSSFVQAASTPGEGIAGNVGPQIQAITSLATEVVTAWAQRSAEKARALQAAAEAAERADRDRIKALRDGDMPIMRQVWDERWWQRVSADQAGASGLAEIGMAWEVTGGWARNGDPMGRRTQQRLRELIKDRFNVDMPDEPVNSTLAAEILAAPQGAERQVSFVIYDTADGSTVERGTLSMDVDDRLPLRVVAADKLTEFRAARNDGTEPSGRLVIDVYDGSRPGGERRQMLRDDQAVETRIEYDEWARDVLAGTAEAPVEAARDVHLVERQRLRRELRRLREADPRLAAARETLADEVALRQGADPRTTPPTRDGARMSVEEHDAAMAEVTRRLEQLQLRIDQINADLLGEDVAVVNEAAILRRDLEPEWWDTATAEEIAGTWTHVGGWPDGAAKNGMRADLQEQILQRYGVDVGAGASFAKVSGEVQRAQAERRGERIVAFRVEGPGQATQTGDSFTVSAATVEASGVESVPRDESLAAFAKRQLGTFAGDLDAARERRLIIKLSDPTGAPLGAFDAAGIVDRRKGPDEREAEYREGRAANLGDEAQRDDAAAVEREGAPGSPTSGELHREAATERGSAAEDLMDATALRDIADSDPGAEEAVRAARTSRQAWPQHERPASGGIRRSRAKRQGLGSRGDRAPRSWPRMHPRGTGRGD